jgi:hypothetical protein
MRLDEVFKVRLTIENEEYPESCGVIKSPKEKHIREELRSEGFDLAILESTDALTFIQCRLIEETGRYLLEYQDGSEDRHYQTESPVSYSRAVSAFIWYLRGDESWLSEFAWERIEI